MASRVIGTALFFVLLILAYFTLFGGLIATQPPANPSSNASVDWAGYTAATDQANPQPTVTAVSGYWTVPQVSATLGDSFSAIWVGIGGVYDETLIQVGSEQDYYNGTPYYYAWYELLPDYSITIDTLNVSAGDTITATVSLTDSAASLWTIEIHDLTNRGDFKQSLTYASQRLSVEWIAERPVVNTSTGPLADFGALTLAGCTATIGGQQGAISAFAYTQITMYDNRGNQLAAASPLSADGSAFTVTYTAATLPLTTLHSNVSHVFLVKRPEIVQP